MHLRYCSPARLAQYSKFNRFLFPVEIPSRKLKVAGVAPAVLRAVGTCRRIGAPCDGPYCTQNPHFESGFGLLLTCTPRLTGDGARPPSLWPSHLITDHPWTLTFIRGSPGFSVSSSSPQFLIVTPAGEPFSIPSLSPLPPATSRSVAPAVASLPLSKLVMGASA